MNTFLQRVKRALVTRVANTKASPVTIVCGNESAGGSANV